MQVHIQSDNEEEIKLFFSLLSESIAIELETFEAKGKHNAMFQLDFRELQKLVTNQTNVTKQDININSTLIGVIGLYRSQGQTFEEIAERMNKEGYRNSRNNKLNKMQVNRLYKKYQEEVKAKLKKGQKK